MKKEIWKYKINSTTNTLLEMPKGSEILSAQNQFENICLWALVNPKCEEKESRLIQVFGTGEWMPEKLVAKRIHIDTVQLHRGKIILHVFETILK